MDWGVVHTFPNQVVFASLKILTAALFEIQLVKDWNKVGLAS